MEMTTGTTSDPKSRPVVIAHRGASAEAPENTIAAFERAIEHRADAIQLDIHMSRDEQPVVIHDFTLERTTDGRGRVQDRTVRELKRLDSGGWYDPRFRGQRIQTLQEVFERFRERTRFWIELKGGSGFYPGLEEKVVSMIEIYDVLQATLLQSSDSKALEQVEHLNSDVRLGIVTAEPTIEALIRSGIVGCAICPADHLVTENDISEIRRAGLACYVWTVNEPARMDRLVEWGATGIITDLPGLLRARCNR
jgi:glycerophosphoryl diester phosphodiesterase